MDYMSCQQKNVSSGLVITFGQNVHHQLLDMVNVNLIKYNRLIIANVISKRVLCSQDPTVALELKQMVDQILNEV